MRAIEPKTLEWAPSAPVQNVARAHSSASPDAVFAVIADQEAWPAWFPRLKSVTVSPGPLGVGSRRTVRLPGLAVDEVVIGWEPGRLFAFTGVAVRPYVFSELVEQCVLDPTDDGGTDIAWVQSLTPGNAVFRAVFRFGRRGVLKALEQGMTNLARRAESPR
ncbi:MAG: SRPBCC family protein [Acidimicrobiales bacterium]